MAKRNTAGFVLFMLGVLALLFVGGMVLLWRFAEFDSTGPEQAMELHEEGMLFLRQRNPLAALDSFSAAIEIDTDLLPAWSSRARTHLQMGQFGPARDDFSQAIRLEPDEATHYMGRGRAADQLGELEPAIDDYSRALELTGLDPTTQRFRGWARLRSGDYAGAVEDFGAVIQDRPSDENTRHNLAWAHWGRGDFDRAAELYSASISTGRASQSAFLGRGATRLYAGDPDAALTDLAQAAGINDRLREYARLYLWLARSSAGERERADRDLRADDLAGGWPGALQQFLLDDTDEATLLALAAVQGRQPPTAHRLCEAHYYAGMKRSLARDEEAAIDHFRRCLDTGLTTFYEYYGAMAELARRGVADPIPAASPGRPPEGSGA
jgi:tetratricopeptide (TPR) repeat protein